MGSFSLAPLPNWRGAFYSCRKKYSCRPRTA